jgi:hypothetical protein
VPRGTVKRPSSARVTSMTREGQVALTRSPPRPLPAPPHPVPPALCRRPPESHPGAHSDSAWECSNRPRKLPLGSRHTQRSASRFLPRSPLASGAVFVVWSHGIILALIGPSAGMGRWRSPGAHGKSKGQPPTSRKASGGHFQPSLQHVSRACAAVLRSVTYNAIRARWRGRAGRSQLPRRAARRRR